MKEKGIRMESKSGIDFPGYKLIYFLHLLIALLFQKEKLYNYFLKLKHHGFFEFEILFYHSNYLKN